MLCKAAVMGDIAIYRQLLNTTSPQLAKRWGTQVNDFDVAKWTRVVCSVAFHVVYQKFKQCARLQLSLLETGEKLKMKTCLHFIVDSFSLGGGFRGGGLNSPPLGLAPCCGLPPHAPRLLAR